MNRRGFFGSLVGLAAGVYAAFQKSEAKANSSPELQKIDTNTHIYYEIAFTLPIGNPVDCHIYKSKSNSKDVWELTEIDS